MRGVLTSVRYCIYVYVYIYIYIWDILPETYISTCKNLGKVFFLLLNLNIESYGGHVKL